MTEEPNDAGKMELDLFRISVILFKKRKTILYSIIMGLILASLYLHVATYYYTATLTVVPVRSVSNSLTSKLGGLSDIASLAGLELPEDSGSTQFQLYLEGLHSRTVADMLAKRTDLMKVIFKYEWDAKNNTWQQPQGFLTSIKSVIRYLLGMPDYAWEPPNGAQLEPYLKEYVSVGQVPKKSLVIISYKNPNPTFAAAFLQALHEAVEMRLREKAMTKSQEYINFLTGKLKTVTVAEQRQAILYALNDEEKTVMAASANAPFAAESFGAPSASYRPTSPMPMVVLAVGLLGGMWISMGFILLNAVRPLPVVAWPQFRTFGWFGRARRFVLRKVGSES